MLRHARNKVNARRFDARMAEDIRQLDDLLVCAIKCRREQVAQIVRENFPCVDTCAGAQLFHFRPNLISRHGLAAFGAKDRAGGGFLLRSKLEQLLRAPTRSAPLRRFDFQRASFDEKKLIAAEFVERIMLDGERVHIIWKA